MSYEYKLESKIFFLIFSITIISLILAVLYYSSVNFNKSILFIIYIIVGVFLLFIGLFSSKTTTFFYSIIKDDSSFSECVKKMGVDACNKDLLKMIKRYKEVFYNLSFGDKEKSIDIIQRTVGISDDLSKKIYYVLKNINRNKSFLIMSGIVISVVVYILLNKIVIFSIISQTKFLPISISLIILFIFIFQSVSISRLPISFYLNIISINKKQLTQNKVDLKNNEDELSKLYKEKNDNKEKIKNVVAFLLSKDIKKKDIIDILNSKGLDNFELRNLIMDVNEGFKSVDLKTNYQEVSDKIDLIIELYKKIKEIDLKLFIIKKNITQMKKIQETIEKINSDDWDYYRNIKLDLITKSKDFDKNIDEEILNKINHRTELIQNQETTLNNLYNTFLPYKDTITKDKISSILISKGYSYEILNDIFDEFKKNNINLDKNKKTFQEKLISKINSIYDSFKE